MNKEWYNIDVKREVLKDIQNHMADNSMVTEIIELIKDISVRNMMDISYIRMLGEIDNPEQFTEFVSERYMYYRSQKYGHEGFWKSASDERNIGYSGLWYVYISNMLKKYCRENDKVLFVGTADGREIPDDGLFEYYALEQIGNSVSHIDSGKVVKSYAADFEDDTFVIGNGKLMNAIAALRCMMPNTRIGRFLQFVENNLQHQGVLIVSHPMGFLNVDNEFMPLPEFRKKLKDFDYRLKNEILNHENMKIIYEEETNVEYFYIVKVN